MIGRSSCTVVFVGFLAVTPPVAAQDAQWDVEGELGASVFFGNTEQTTFNSRLAAARADSTYEVATQGTFTYGEATDGDDRQFVAKRAWNVEASLDWHPYARISPFLFTDLESSYERRIDLRYNGGAGGKLTILRSDQSRVDLSVALLAEQTFAREGPAGPPPDESVHARWSTRLRARDRLADGRMTLSTENYYRPVFGEYGNYVLESTSSASFAMSELLTLKLTFVDTYDSRAVARGAETNHDGQFFVSVLSTF